MSEQAASVPNPIASAPVPPTEGPGSSTPNPIAAARDQAVEPKGPDSIYDAITGQTLEGNPNEAAPIDPATAANRPDYLLEKYANEADQAKAYPELLKKFGEFKGAPENYDLTKLPEHLNKESPLITKMAERFKEMNLSQEGFEAIVKDFVSVQEEFSEVKPQQILEELGPTGKDIISRVGNWIKNFSPEEQALLKSWSMSGKDIQLLDKLRASVPLSRAPTQNDFMGSSGHETLKAVEAEKAQNWDRYRTDPAYASEISRRYQDAAMREGYSQESFGEMKRR